MGGKKHRVQHKSTQEAQNNKETVVRPLHSLIGVNRQVLAGTASADKQTIDGNNHKEPRFSGN